MLKPVLAANALSCLVFGALFAAAAPAVAAFLGDPPVWLVRAVGVGLILNGAHLAFTARKAQIRRAEALWFAAGDAAWVAATAILLLSNIWISTPSGAAVAIAVALWVGACGLTQWRLAPSCSS